MMVPLVQRRLLQAVLAVQPEIKSIYDPFVGSGTSLVSAMHFGLAAYGTDINPLAVLISRVRTSRRVNFSVGLIGKEVALTAREDASSSIETDMKNRGKWFTEDVAIELSRLRRAIRQCNDLWVRRFLWVSLAETIRLTSNDRTSTYKLHARPVDEIALRNASPIDVFSDTVSRSADSFAFFRKKLQDAGSINKGRYVAETGISLADSREGGGLPKQSPFDLMMTSPPYGDNLTTVTYGQHSYLPLSWIDWADIDPKVDADLLRTTHEIDRRSLGGGAADQLADDILFQLSPTLQRSADAIPASSRDGRARLLRFYSDVQLSLNSLVGRLRDNAYMIWTVGNRNIASTQVPTDRILCELLSASGCTTVTTLTRRIYHKRMPDRNASSATMKEEQILLVRKLPA
jgi:hypothetical protein